MQPWLRLLAYVASISFETCPPSSLNVTTLSTSAPLSVTGGGGSFIQIEQMNISFVFALLTSMPALLACWTSSSMNDWMQLMLNLSSITCSYCNIIDELVHHAGWAQCISQPRTSVGQDMTPAAYQPLSTTWRLKAILQLLVTLSDNISTWLWCVCPPNLVKGISYSNSVILKSGD